LRCVKIGAERIELVETPTHARARLPLQRPDAPSGWRPPSIAVAMLYKQANLGVHIMRANLIFLIGNCLNNGHRRYMAWAVEIPTHGRKDKAMAERIGRETAKIYQFPVGGRASRVADSKHTQDNAAAAHLPHVDFGGGWYHDAAIEAERPAKH
jgi:hypothetical protein